MPDIGQALTSKLGPFPVWVYLAGGGVILYFVTKGGGLSSILPGSSSSNSTNAATTATTAAGQATASEAAAQQAAASASGQTAGSQLSSELGLLQQLQAFNQQSVSSYQQTAAQLNPSTQSTANSFTVTNPSGATIFNSATPGQGQGVPNNTPLTSAGTIPPGTILTGTGNAQSVQWGNTQVSVTPVTYQGQQVFVTSQQVTPSQQASSAGGSGGGRGGPARSRLGAAHPVWRSGHPTLRSGNVTMPHFALGGPANVHAAAAKVGVHPARLLALNEDAKKGTVPPGHYMRVA